MSDADRLSDALRAGRVRLLAGLQGLGEEQFRFTGDDGWNIATHLAHLLRCERMLTERASRALREDEPLVASTGINNDDDPALAQRLAVPQIIHGLQAARRELETLLEGLDDTALERVIVHERDGRVTARALIEKAAAHEVEHAGAIELLARQARAADAVTIPIVRS
jgi:uncharacterized damage-inducible protein DinB